MSGVWLRAAVGESYDFVSLSLEQTDQNEFGSDVDFQGRRFRATLVGITASATDFDDPTSTLILSKAFLKQ